MRLCTTMRSRGDAHRNETILGANTRICPPRVVRILLCSDALEREPARFASPSATPAGGVCVRPSKHDQGIVRIYALEASQRFSSPSAPRSREVFVCASKPGSTLFFQVSQFCLLFLHVMGFATSLFSEMEFATSEHCQRSCGLETQYIAASRDHFSNNNTFFALQCA